ncbi:uncharacterized protein LOC108098290 [Drosophila ficusphila]|uniref:uncharacterized protein LOC108098290 n=1 Tax=Drosophila ficusphila TaxID=30025 RepID=UPI0007E89943|nr:uncharacterized protein LOC108098290 [Drosophila ficusphila]
MDLSKAESQTPAKESRSGGSGNLKTLLQDLLCFFVLLSVALLIVAGILFVVEDVSRLQQQHLLSHHKHNHQHHRLHHHRDQIVIDSQASPAEEPPKQERQYFRPYTWIRLFSCQKKLQHQQLGDAEKEAVVVGPQNQDDQEQQPLDLVPTYQPFEPLPFQEGGDQIEKESASKHIISDPHQHLADNLYRTP